MNRSQRGFTMIEMAISVALFGLVGASFSRSFVTTSGLTAESRAQAKAQEELRRSLDTIANDLRSVAYSSLLGFDVNGAATTFTCQRVIGADGTGKLLAPVESIGWRSTPTSVRGIASPGEIVSTQGGVTRVIAGRVPAGGLVVTLGANRLRITLTCYWSTRDGRTVIVSGETTVGLRD